MGVCHSNLAHNTQMQTFIVKHSSSAKQAIILLRRSGKQARGLEKIRVGRVVGVLANWRKASALIPSDTSKACLVSIDDPCGLRISYDLLNKATGRDGEQTSLVPTVVSHTGAVL